MVLFSRRGDLIPYGHDAGNETCNNPDYIQRAAKSKRNSNDFFGRRIPDLRALSRRNIVFITRSVNG
jgi:hypothetical protein